MFSRLLKPPTNKSFFLFGPRGTGKTSWVRSNFPSALYFDLLEASVYSDLLAAPDRLEQFIPKGFNDWIIIDEVQKVPELLDEVHRLIELYKYKFILTGSSARKLRKKGVNLLAGRALRYTMHPLTATELEDAFDLSKTLRWGLLPSAQTEMDPKKYLESYVSTYLREEVLQEGLTRNLGAFSRFLEAASFSQCSMLNVSNVARECAIERKTVEGYFSILEDLLLSFRLPVFTKRAKRRLVAHPKFYIFDTGVYQTIRPRGPLDSGEEINGAGLETLFLQHLRALNDYLSLDYTLYFWRTITDLEVDFVAYGPRGLIAFEVKSTSFFHPGEAKSLLTFKEEYPMAKLFFIYGGKKEMYHQDISVLPAETALKKLPQLLENA